MKTLIIYIYAGRVSYFIVQGDYSEFHGLVLLPGHPIKRNSVEAKFSSMFYNQKKGGFSQKEIKENEVNNCVFTSIAVVTLKNK